MAVYSQTLLKTRAQPRGAKLSGQNTDLERTERHSRQRITQLHNTATKPRKIGNQLEKRFGWRQREGGNACVRETNWGRGEARPLKSGPGSYNGERSEWQTDMGRQGRMVYSTHTEETSDRSVTTGILHSQYNIFFLNKKNQCICHQIIRTDTTRDRTRIL